MYITRESGNSFTTFYLSAILYVRHRKCNSLNFKHEINCAKQRPRSEIGEFYCSDSSTPFIPRHYSYPPRKNLNYHSANSNSISRGLRGEDSYEFLTATPEPSRVLSNSRVSFAPVFIFSQKFREYFHFPDSYF